MNMDTVHTTVYYEWGFIGNNRGQQEAQQTSVTVTVSQAGLVGACPAGVSWTWFAMTHASAALCV